MPRGRFLSRAISLDEKVNNLPNDTARLLFTWLIPHLDCEGRLHGDAITVKSIVFPRRPISTRKVEQYLNAIEKSGLIMRYSVNGNSYLFAPHFEKHQVGLQKSKEAQSQIPPPPLDLLQSKDGVSLLQVEVEGKVKDKVKVVVGEDNNNLQNELTKLNGWGTSHLKEDGVWLAEFLKDYPEFNASHIRACRDYHSNKVKHNVAYWKTRLRNWMKREEDYKEKGGQGETHRGSSRDIPKTYKTPEQHLREYREQ